jgi:FtsP/CotA-like multicopper oxidase with cupredoxin domain
MRLNRRKVLLGAFLLTPLVAGIQNVSAQPLPGGTLDPTTIPKYVTPLVIPPVMNDSGTAGDYNIAVRQFQQQILPGGIWSTLNPAIGTTLPSFPATTIWSYGPDADPLPDSTALGGGKGIAPAPNSQFNYPAYTMENEVNTPTHVDWINDLTTKAWQGKKGKFLPHLLAVDQTLHWANPLANCSSAEVRTDCHGVDPLPYMGPVPIITHVHGAHVSADSDGYTEAWWLPDAKDIKCVKRKKDGTLKKAPAGLLPNGKWEVACEGSLANELTDRAGNVSQNTNQTRGVGNFIYQNDQPSTTIWYHDHSLGMTRLNVYAGPAGFWLIREPGGGETGLASGILPGPAPVRGEDLATTNLPEGIGGARHKYREIPIVIQDRSFNADGSLFYPDNRAFFEGLNVAGTNGGVEELNIPFAPASDIAPIWNPEAFFNTMVVNGVTWPKLEVAPAQYRFRLLDGCNSRFLNLALKVTDALGNPATVTKTVYLDRTYRGRTRTLVKTVPNVSELDFYQIGAEQSLKPTVTAIRTGRAIDLATATFDKLGQIVDPVADPILAPADAQKALMMGLAERADVIVDFRGLPDGTVITLTNTAPDAPFGGFPDTPAHEGTTGQVMQFVVNSAHLGLSPTDELRDPVNNTPVNPATAASDVRDLVVDPAALENFSVNVTATAPRELALLEEESALVCWDADGSGGLVAVGAPGSNGACAVGEPAAPKAAVLGVFDSAGDPVVTLWSDPITTNVNADGSGAARAEQWNINNLTVDGHPIHVHLVKFKVLGRTAIGGGPSVVAGAGIEPWEDGWKDTVVAYPGETTSIAADFDINGLYVWHCHIVEHEDNEMMVPLCVGVAGQDCPAKLFPL